MPGRMVSRINQDLTAVCAWIGRHSHQLHEREFVDECTRIGSPHIAHIIQNMFTHAHSVSMMATRIVENYMYVTMAFPLYSHECIPEEIHEVFQSVGHPCVCRHFDDMSRAYHLHQHMLREDDQVFAASAALSNLYSRSAQMHNYVSEPIRRSEEDEDSMDAWRDRQQDDEDLEAAAEENRQDMAEYNEAQMEAYEDNIRWREGDDHRSEVEDEYDTQGVVSTPEAALDSVTDAAQALRDAFANYTRIRKSVEDDNDPKIPLIIGAWIQKPTADGRGIEETFDEVVTDAEVRNGTDACPWPFFVYENHVNAEIAKGTECPITMVPLASCAYVNVSMNCGHIYETGAIQSWTHVTGRTSSSCPTCRAPIAGMWRMRVKSVTSSV